MTPAPPPRGLRATSRAGSEPRPSWGLGRLGLALLGAALAAIVLGYVLLDRGSITAAPLLLVLGYVVLVPAALLAGGKGA